MTEGIGATLGVGIGATSGAGKLIAKRLIIRLGVRGVTKTEVLYVGPRTRTWSDAVSKRTHETAAYQAVTILGFHEGIPDVCRNSEKTLPLQSNSNH